MRKPIIAGNWKMNNTNSQAVKLVENIKKISLSKDVEALVCVPFTALQDVKKALEGTDIKVGAQNMHWEESGAFTGEISALMLKEMGVDYCIIGHSERRQYFNETDETVNNKLKAALAHGLLPIICVGETLEQRENGEAKEVVKNQILKGFSDISNEDIKDIVLAYEPIWAIGTGKTASSDDANDMCAFVRETIGQIYGDNEKQIIRIQYGGSVNPNNVVELMGKTDIDGALVGGASLKADDFTKLVNF